MEELFDIKLTKSEAQILLDAMDIAYADDDAPIYETNPDATEVLENIDIKLRSITTQG